MSKRIYKIEIENFKVFRTHFTLEIPNGNNVLLYGENGSGKSSMYKAFDYFFRKSVNEEIAFSHNIHSESEKGIIRLYFDEESPILDENGNSESVEINTASADNKSTFKSYVSDASRARGFLDYTKLLKVYLSDNQTNNLFPLFLDLYRDYTPETMPQGGTIGHHFNYINNSLSTCYNRKQRKYKEAASSLIKFDERFKYVLKKTFDKANELLSKYFEHFGIKVDYELSPFKIPTKCKIRDIKIEGSLKLKVEKSGKSISNYKEVLNEARLSAFASCLYLASIKTMPKQLDYKILFLDDIFIGLDMGNRLPILRMIKNEFSDFQIFLTSYDRSWYEMAKILLGNGWLCGELYGIKQKLKSGHIVYYPTFVVGDSDFDKGRRYLHNTEYPDYPAAANYFRKYIEKIIPEGFGFLVKYTKELDPIQSYKLNEILNRALKWCKYLSDIDGGTDNLRRLLTEIKAFLPVLLHPLSHYTPHVLPYKGELAEIESLIHSLEKELKKLNLANNIKALCSCENDLEFELEDTLGWHYKYMVKLEDHLVLFKSAENNYKINSCPCFICKMSGKKNDGSELLTQTIKKNDKLYKNVSANSLEELYNNTVAYLESEVSTKFNHQGVSIKQAPDYIESFSSLNKNIKTTIANIFR